MSNNTVLNIGTGGDTIQNIAQIGGQKTPVGVLTDSTGTYFTAVKPASTPAVATDQALVVAISPNNTIGCTYPTTSASGTITSTQAVTIQVAGLDTVGLEVSGTWTGNLTIQGQVNSVWQTTTYVSLSSGRIFNTLTGNDVGQINCAGLTSVRILGNTITSGTATINLNANSSGSLIMLDNPLPPGGNVIGAVTQLPGSQDIFGANVVTSRNNQINIQFNSGVLQNLVNITATGSAFGSLSTTTGMAQFSSGTATSATILASSPSTLTYQSGSELYAEFTASFTTPTSSASTQQIGLFNLSNGFLVGYNGTTFGIASINAGTTINVNQSSFNVDTLTGLQNSLFTSNGSPVAFVTTNLNVFRIRFGWLGVASIFYEILSPDGNWVIFHKIVYPNNFTTPHLVTPNLPVSVYISKTSSDATNLIIGTACWGAGITGSVNPQSSLPALRGSNAVITTPAQQNFFKPSFANVLASTADTNFWNNLVIGTGGVASQGSGVLNIGSGVTVNSETILRSKQSFTGPLIFKFNSYMSQRIVNSNFYVELVDVIGDGLALTVNSATSVTVTIPNNPFYDPLFTGKFVGQKMWIGNVLNIASTIPSQQATIASSTATTVTFTVVTYPASGSGTCSLFGWNYHQVVFGGTVVTAATYDTCQQGWPQGQSNITTNTTAAPGTQIIINSTDSRAMISDMLTASSGTQAIQAAPRGSKNTNLPDAVTPLYLQIRSLNGTTAPTSTTVQTFKAITIENFTPVQVSVNDVKSNHNEDGILVQVSNTSNAITVGGTVVCTGYTANVAVGSSNYPQNTGGVAIFGTNPTKVGTSGYTSNFMTDAVGRLVVTNGHTRTLTSRQITTITSSITATTIVTAGAAGIFNDLTTLNISNSSATGTLVTLTDNATTAGNYWVPASSTLQLLFNIPLTQATAATAWTLTCGTSVASIYVNATFNQNV
jgi:hypothetical protein